MESTLLKRFGENARQARLNLKLSQEELAEKAGFHRTYIGMIERAERNITLLNIEKLAAALEVEMSDLLK